MKKYYSLFFVVLFLLLFIQLPEVEAEKSVRTTDLLAAEGYVAYIVNSYKPETPVNPVSDCTCNGKKYIDYDNSGNYVQCKCGDNCTCEKEIGSVQVKKKAPSEEEIYKKYYVIKFTAPWCSPCNVWGQKEKGELLKNGVKVTEIDADTNKQILSKYNVTSLPSFLICDNENKQIHLKSINKSLTEDYFYQTYSTSSFLLEKILKLNEELSK